ncbi:hypothetical protein Tco_1365113 [Tanacetum coccineum]
MEVPVHPPSLDYVPGLKEPEQALLSLNYVPEPDHEISVVEDQPLPVDTLSTALSPGYVADSDLEEDPEEDLADYLDDGGDEKEEEEESSESDDDVEEDEASEEDEDEEEEHLALADSAAATPPPRSPRTKVPFSQTRLLRARKTARHQPSMAASTESLIAEYVVAPTPLSPPPSPLSPCSSPLPYIQSPPLPILSPPLPLPSLPTHTSPTYAEAPLGYRAAMIQSDIPKTDMPFLKRLCLTALDSRFEIGESLTAAAARQTGHTLARRVDYGFIDTVDASIRASKSRAMTVVEEVNEIVTDLATTQRQDAHELHMRDEDAHDDRALMRAQISLLTRERRYFHSMASSYEREAIIARQAWSRSEDRSTALEASIRTLKAQVRTLQTQHDKMEWQRQQAGDMVTSAFRCIHALAARDRARTGDTGPQDGPADAGSSC